MKSTHKYSMDKKRFFLFLSFMFILTIVNAGTINKDSLKSKYDINDPRNPNCPCHKHQKLADEEYNQWLKKQSIGTGIAINKLDVREDKLKRKNGFSFLKSKHKLKSKSHPVLRRVFDFKRYNILRKVKETDACFKWKK